MLLDPLVSWSYEISWQTKTIISPLPRCLSPPNLLRVWLTMRGSQSYRTTWRYIRVILQIKWRSKNISPLPQCLGNKTRRDDDKSWEAPTRNNAQPFDQLVLRDHVTNKNISALPRWLWSQNLAFWWLKSHDYIITTRSCEIMRQTKSIYRLPQCLWCQTWQDGLHNIKLSLRSSIK